MEERKFNETYEDRIVKRSLNLTPEDNQWALDRAKRLECGNVSSYIRKLIQNDRKKVRSLPKMNSDQYELFEDHFLGHKDPVRKYHGAYNNKGTWWQMRSWFRRRPKKIYTN